MKKEIKARIDSHNKTVHARQADQVEEGGRFLVRSPYSRCRRSALSIARCRWGWSMRDRKRWWTAGGRRGGGAGGGAGGGGRGGGAHRCYQTTALLLRLDLIRNDISIKANKVAGPPRGDRDED
eukprot:180826-Hanusia_phi.AAC.4